MRVMEQIARNLRKLLYELRGHVRMSVGGNEDAKSGRGQQARDKFPGCRRLPRPTHDSWMSGHAQEFVQN